MNYVELFIHETLHHHAEWIDSPHDPWGCKPMNEESIFLLVRRIVFTQSRSVYMNFVSTLCEVL